jgi:hypothetical protein
MNIINAEKVTINDQYQARLSFLNNLGNSINFSEVTKILAHSESDLHGWYGIEALICKDNLGRVYDVDIRYAWSNKIFQQNLIDCGWTESILLSNSSEQNRYKLIIYLCEDTIKTSEDVKLQSMDKNFIFGNYWQGIDHLYLKILDDTPFDLAISGFRKVAVDISDRSLKITEQSSQIKSDEDRQMVSIVTIVKNGEKYLEQTIQSVINQTYSNIEYIIVDGGSTDGTLDIVRKYESEISYWISEPDEGISDAFNKGVSFSNGFLVGILSADDLYFQASVIESIVEKSKINPTISFYFGDCLYDSDRNISKLEGDDRYAKKLGFFMPHIHHPTVFMQREVLINIPFSTAYKLCMDYHLFVRLNKQGLLGSRYNGLVTIVRNCGVSNRLYYRTQKEVFRASTEQGTSKILAALIYIIFTVRYWLKDKLTK